MSKVIWNSICKNDVCIYEKLLYIVLLSLYNCKIRGSDKFFVYNILIVMFYIVFYLRFFFKNIFNWFLYYVWIMLLEFDKELRINVKNDWRCLWKIIIFVFYFYRICMLSL